MKTFSIMCLGDLALTADSYELMIIKLKHDKITVRQDCNYGKKVKEISDKIDRIIQLRTAVQNELQCPACFNLQKN